MVKSYLRYEPAAAFGVVASVKSNITYELRNLRVFLLKKASGHADGSVRIWDCERGTCETTLNGHKGASTVIRFNKTGSLLASGSEDNGIVLWDVIGELQLFRLRGHCDQIPLCRSVPLQTSCRVAHGATPIHIYVDSLGS
ncbi:hypothetical protein L1987_67695 [Smallanthus sonchifolius]|uniref:Uncharacterized protein n=1 Tax=Smallanthus sonchifolius TaxID=185202 RepID=A0ACB9B4H2_9ASTR|nr:hypothetical protein L1987_67695 [Smallanthus sonchifolius]